jgi:hypothetical protein
MIANSAMFHDNGNSSRLVFVLLSNSHSHWARCLAV